MLEYQRHANELRHRLRNPPNAVPDSAWPVAPQPARITRDEFHKRCLEFFNKSVECPPEPRKIEVRNIGRAFLVQSIMDLVAANYSISVNEMISMRREAHVCRARQITMWLIKEMTGMTLPWIGNRLGGRDHTTVLHGVRKINECRKTDPALQLELDQFLSALRPIMENSNATASRNRSGL